MCEGSDGVFPSQTTQCLSVWEEVSRSMEVKRFLNWELAVVGSSLLMGHGECMPSLGLIVLAGYLWAVPLDYSVPGWQS